jgi:hypothetical protein
MRTETATQEKPKAEEQSERTHRELKPLPRATREEIEAALAQGRLVGETLIPLREAQNGRKNGH